MLTEQVTRDLLLIAAGAVVPLLTLITTLISNARKERRQEERDQRRLDDERTYVERAPVREQGRLKASEALDAISAINDAWTAQGYPTNPHDTYEVPSALTTKLSRAANLIPDEQVRETVRHAIDGIYGVHYVYRAGNVIDEDENWAGSAQRDILRLASEAINRYLRGEPSDPDTLQAAIAASDAARAAHEDIFGV